MKIFRKRFIPNEIVDISGDEVIYRDDKKLITKWSPIKPRADIGSGTSCVYFDIGIKVSKFFDNEGNFKFWYCDIISYTFDKDEDKYIFTDLLLDVKVYVDGHFEVLDEDELEEALSDKLITLDEYSDAKNKKDYLINLIKNNEFKNLDF